MSAITTIPTRLIGGVKVGAVGYGCMGLRVKQPPPPDDQAFACFTKSIDSGATLFNSASFYGRGDPLESLKQLNRFFVASPEYKDRIFLTVKGAFIGMPHFKPDCSDEGLLASVTEINNTLLGEDGQGRKMDLFAPARVDKTRPIEETMKTLVKLRDEGHFKYIGLSECSAETLRRAAAVTTITSVEVEYSPWSLNIETNGVLEACKELGVAVIAYSPLGRGFLTGQLKTQADLPENDIRRMMDRFQPEAFEKNLVLVDKLKSLAEVKGISLTQLVLAWELSQWEGIIPIPGSTRVEGVEEAATSANIKLTIEVIKAIREVSPSPAPNLFGQ
ncbi:Aldo/keto reductase [Meredithblackwellia eburnea MCA 4105]